MVQLVQTDLVTLAYTWPRGPIKQPLLIGSIHCKEVDELKKVDVAITTKLSDYKCQGTLASHCLCFQYTSFLRILRWRGVLCMSYLSDLLFISVIIISHIAIVKNRTR